MTRFKDADNVSYKVGGNRKVGRISQVVTAYKIEGEDGLFQEEDLEQTEMTDEKLKLIIDMMVMTLKSGRIVSIPADALDDIRSGLIGASEVADLLQEIQVVLPRALRLLGIALYHLASGVSEYNDICFVSDGYIAPIKSKWWPAIDKLANNKLTNIEELEMVLKLIEPAPLPINNVSIITGNNRKAGDIISELANEPIKIIGHELIRIMWGVVIPENIQIRYSETSLREVIEANAKGEKWVLGYYTGQNLRQMKQKLNTGRPSFSNTNWWCEANENSWANKTDIEPGYYLLNFIRKFPNVFWESQERLIYELGPAYKRCHEFVVGEIALSNFRVYNGERLLDGWYHWGKELSFECRRVAVGGHGMDGFNVRGQLPSDPKGNLCVVVARNFDF